MQSNTGGILRQPDQTVKEWKEQDWFDNLRFIASNWNKVIYEFAPDDQAISQKPKYWVNDYIQNASYFFGKNQSTDYGFVIRDEVNNPMPFPLYRGQDIYELIKHTVGVIGDFVRSVPKILSCQGLSEGVTSKKQLMMDFAKFQAENTASMQMMEMVMGLKFQPTDLPDFENTQQVDKYFETFQDGLEKIYITLSKYVFMFNHGVEFFEKQSEYYGIGGVISCRVYAHNGKVKWRLIEPQNAIWDNYKSLNQHRDDTIAGEYCPYSVPEVLSMWNWTEEERKEVQAIANGGTTLWQPFNTPMGNNLVWWRQTPVGVPMITCVHGTWRSLKYEGEKDGKEVWAPCLRTGWLVGNKWIKDNMISPNQLADKTDPTRIPLNYITASADTIMGNCMGIAGRLREYQKYKDFLKTKMTKLISNSKGRTYVMYSDKLPEGLRTPDVLAQLSQAGVVIIPKRDVDDPDPEGNRGLIDAIDMTLDPSILSLAQLIQQERNYMDNIISLPANARGVNPNYQSKDALSINIQQSGYGMSSYYNTFYTWILRILEYSADLAKVIMPEGDEDTLVLLVGDAKAEMVKMKDLQEMQFEDFCLALGVDDFMSDADRQMFIQYYMQKASATNDPEDDLVVLNLTRIKSKTEMNNYLQSVIAAKLERKAQEQQQAAQQQQQMAAQAANAQVQSADIGAQTQLAKQQSEQDHDIDKMLLEKHLNPEPANK